MALHWELPCQTVHADVGQTAHAVGCQTQSLSGWADSLLLCSSLSDLIFKEGDDVSPTFHIYINYCISIWESRVNVYSWRRGELPFVVYTLAGCLQGRYAGARYRLIGTQQMLGIQVEGCVGQLRGWGVNQLLLSLNNYAHFNFITELSMMITIMQGSKQ